MSALVLAAWIAQVAGPDPGLVEWRGPPACQRQPQFAARLTALGVDPPATTRVELGPQTPRGDFDVTVRIETADGSLVRRFSGGPCEAIVDAAALIVAVSLDSLATQAVAPHHPVAGSSAPATATEDSPEPLQWGPLATGAAQVSAAPKATATAAIGLFVQRGVVRLEAEAKHGMRRRYPHPADDRAGASIASWLGRVALCYAPAVHRIRTALCGGAEAGVWRASGYGLLRSTSVVRPWLGVTALARLLWQPRRRVAVGPFAGASMLAYRPRFTIDDFPDPIVQTGRVAVEFGGTIQVDLGDVRGRSRRKT